MVQQMVLTLTIETDGLTYRIETDGRQADAKQHMVLSHTIETDGRRPHNRNRWPHNSRATAFCHAWPILLFALLISFIPLLHDIHSLVCKGHLYIYIASTGLL